MQEVYIGLGSNKGDKNQNIQKAYDLVEKEIGRIMSFSSFYATKPWGKTDQDDFLNTTVKVATELGPQTILIKIKEIEDLLGRKRVEKWGPRTIDIDILYYGDLILDIDDLQIPHPELTERNFVLIPLIEIAPHFVHPVFKLSNKELLEYCEDKALVQKL